MRPGRKLFGSNESCWISSIIPCETQCFVSAARKSLHDLHSYTDGSSGQIAGVHSDSGSTSSETMRSYNPTACPGGIFSKAEAVGNMLKIVPRECSAATAVNSRVASAQWDPSISPRLKVFVNRMLETSNHGTKPSIKHRALRHLRYTLPLAAAPEQHSTPLNLPDLFAFICIPFMHIPSAYFSHHCQLGVDHRPAP